MVSGPFVTVIDDVVVCGLFVTVIINQVAVQSLSNEPLFDFSFLWAIDMKYQRNSGRLQHVSLAIHR